MEESEKRKERLKAMRLEAESGNYSESCSQNLENPFVDSPSEQPQVTERPRFDYYTDPMAAFSANKKKNSNITPQVSQPCYTPPRPRNPDSPNYPARGNYSLDRRSQAQGGHRTFSPLGNPGGNSPFGIPPRSSPNAWGSGTPNDYVLPNFSTGGNFAGPGIHQGGRPGFPYGQGRGQPGSGYPGETSPFGAPQSKSPTWGGSFNAPNNYIPPNSSSGGNVASPGIHQSERPGSPYGQGRGQPGSGYPGETSPFGTPQRSSPNAWGGTFNAPNNYTPPNSSTDANFASPGIHRGGKPSSHYGQGRGQSGSGYRGSPCQGRGGGYRDSGQGRGRGVGSHGRTSAESRPDLYYDRSMVEDPWKQLRPVIWKPLNAPPNSSDNSPSSSRSWLPESISTKKPKVSDTPIISTPQQSLAEYLAASLNEATGKEAVSDVLDT